MAIRPLPVFDLGADLGPGRQPDLAGVVPVLEGLRVDVDRQRGSRHHVERLPVEVIGLVRLRRMA